MAIPDHDLKILWGKAASRCAMPSCREELVVKTNSKDSGNLLIGENCHIVAQKINGPRGKSLLTLKERDRYPNLILLCRNHHTIIDEDPDSWPIEKLYQIKHDHELWVSNLLTEPSDQRFKLYGEIVNFASEAFLFESWDHFSDHATRLILRSDFVSNSDIFCGRIHRIVWPGIFPELEAAIENLAARVNAYVRHFMTRSEPYGEDFYREDKTWKRQGYSPERWNEEVARSDQWQQLSTQLLFNVIMALNEFADYVREHLNTNFMIHQGKFVMQDYFGVLDWQKPGHYIPTEYISVDWD